MIDFEAVALLWEPVYSQLLSGLDAPAGSAVLDCGCGEGLLAASAVKRGWNVVGFDVSGESLITARKLTSGTPVSPAVAAFEGLPFASQSFAAAMGMFVLHHVDLPVAASELKRVMKPGSRARFVETWGHNPLLRAARAMTGRLGVAKWGTEDERPLTMADVEVLRRAGFTVKLEYPGLVLFQLIDNNVLRRRYPLATKVLAWIDNKLDRIPALKPYGYYVIFDLSL